MAAQLAGALRPPRIELFFKTPAELKERLRALTAAGYGSFNLVNKDKKDPMLAWVDVCCEELGPGDDVCAHFSSKYNARGGPALAERLEALAARSQASGLKLSTLVVSGSGTRKKGHFASDLAGALRAPPSPAGVAFNPYEDDMEKERAALATKLKGGGVSSVWLQFGVRLDDLDRELAWLRGAFPALELVGKRVAPGSPRGADQGLRPGVQGRARIEQRECRPRPAVLAGAHQQIVIDGRARLRQTFHEGRAGGVRRYNTPRPALDAPERILEAGPEPLR